MSIEVVEVSAPAPLTSGERRELFAKWSTSLQIPLLRFDEIGGLLDKIAKETTFQSNADLLMLKIRKLCGFANVYPIVSELPAGSFSEAAIQQMIKSAAGGKDAKRAKKRDKVKNMKKNKETTKEKEKEKDKEVDNGATNAKLNTNTYFLREEDVILSKNLHISEPELIGTYDSRISIDYNKIFNETTNVVGLFVDLGRRIMPIDTSIFPRLPGPAGACRSGSFTPEFLENVLFKPYEIWQNGIDLEGVSSVVDKHSIVIMFKDQESIDKTCDLLWKQMVAIMNNLDKSTSAWYIHNLVNLMGLEVSELESESMESAESLHSSYEPETVAKKSKTKAMSKTVKPKTTKQKAKKGGASKKIVDSKEYSILYEEMKKAIYPVREVVARVEEEIAPGFDFAFLQNIPDGVWPLKFDKTFEASVWMDFVAISQRSLYAHLLLAEMGLAKDDGRLGGIIERQKQYNEFAAKSKSIAAEKFNAYYVEMKHRYFIIRKFGFERYTEIMETMPLGMRNVFSILDYVKSGEKKLILLEANRLDKFEKDIASSREPWVAVARTMRYEISESAKHELYKKLRHYIKTSDLSRAPSSVKKDVGLKENDWLRSKSDLPMICPHVRDEFELVREPGVREYLIRNYADETTSLYDSYYCRICGESIAVSRNMEGITTAVSTEGYGHEEDELRTYIWKQVNWIVRADVEFSEKVDEKDTKQFINIVTDKLGVFIEAIERKLGKSKTMSLDEFKNYKRLLTFIYCYAMFIKIVLENPKRVLLRGYTGGKSVDKLIAHVVDRVLTTQNVIIAGLTNVTAEYVSSILIKAYDVINGHISYTSINKSDPVDLGALIKTDPLYILLMRLWQASALGGHKKAGFNDVLKLLAQTSLPSRVVGKSLQNVAGGIYDKAHLPKMRPVNEYNDKTLTKLVKSGNIDDAYRGIAPYRLSASATWLLEYTKSHIYDKPYWRVVIGPGGIDIGVNAEYNAFNRKFDYSEIERNLCHVVQTYRTWNYSKTYSVEWDSKYPGFVDDDYKFLAYKFGNGKRSAANAKILGIVVEKGLGFHSHKWDITVLVPTKEFKSGNGLGDYKNPMIIKGVMKEFVTEPMLYLDRYCGVCGFGWKEIVKAIPNVWKEFDEYELMRGFYNFYLKQCPKPADEKHGNNLHEFGKKPYDAGGKCVNCGITETIVTDMDAGYFNKYRKLFETNTHTLVTEKIKIPTRTISKDVSGFKQNMNLATEFVLQTYEAIRTGSDIEGTLLKGMGLTKNEYVNMINNLGLTHDIEYDLIKKGTKDPSLTLKVKNDVDEAACFKRRNALHPYIQGINLLMGIIANHEYEHDHELKLMFESASKTDIAKFVSLNGISLYKEKYYNLYNQIQSDLDPYMQAQWMYNYLLRLIMEIIKTMKSFAPAVSKHILVYILRDIIGAEDAASKLKAQRRTEVEAQQSTGEVDPNMIDNSNTRAYDDIVDPDASDKYGYEEMDYAGENEDV